jgi:serine protease Do
MRWLATALLAALAPALATATACAAPSAGAFATAGAHAQAHADTPAAPPASAAGALSAAAPSDASLEERIVAVSEQLRPSVVHVEAIVRLNDRRSQVTGSGLIASADGLIVTNQHVVERAEKVEVSVPGHRRRFPAEILGTDKQTDIALLRIQPGAPLPAATFGDTSTVRVGQWVLAIGNPYDLDGTVSLGIVSAKGRNLAIPDLINEFIQTDAMIDRGSSGGPLVDLEGRVIGINSRGQGRGIGFTIPIDTVLAVMEQIQGGGVERGWLGVTIQPLNRDLAAYFAFPDATGVVVNGVTTGSPAAKAGLQPGDVITALDGVAVEAERDDDLGRFQRRVAERAPGDEATLTLLRAGRTRQVRVRLGEQPRVEPVDAETNVGFHVQEITENLYRQARLASRQGAYVSFVAAGSPAAEAGLLPGDVVERVDDLPVTDLPAFERAMQAVDDKARFLLHARRGGDVMFLLVHRGARPAIPPLAPGVPGPDAPGPGEAAAGTRDEAPPDEAARDAR